MSHFPLNPTDEVLAALVAEFTTELSIFGRKHGDLGTGPDRSRVESLESWGRPELQPSTVEHLIEAYLRDEPYLPGALPAQIPDDWQTLRTHKLSRNESGGVYYQFLQYLPVVSRLAPSADPAQYTGVAEANFKALVAGLTKLVGKPYRKQKQKVEFEWGLTNPTDRGNASSPWGGVELRFGSTKDYSLGNGDALPWGTAQFTISLMGKPRP